MLKKRGQVSVEFVITVGFAMLFIIPLTILLYQYTSQTHEDVSLNQAGLIARTVTDAANEVYYLGHPSTLTVKVFMPEYIEKVNLSGRNIIFTSYTGFDIVSTANVNLTGSVSPNSGLRLIQVTAYDNFVNVTDNVQN